MRIFLAIALVAAVVLATTVAAASSLAVAGAEVPYFGQYASTDCDLDEVDVVADYYIVAPKTGYYSGFQVRGSGSKAGCDGYVIYARVTHSTHYYYLKIDVADVPVDGTWAVFGIFEAEPGEPPVYSTGAFNPAHVVSHDPDMTKSVFQETQILVSNVFPAEF